MVTFQELAEKNELLKTRRLSQLKQYAELVEVLKGLPLTTEQMKKQVAKGYRSVTRGMRHQKKLDKYTRDREDGTGPQGRWGKFKRGISERYHRGRAESNRANVTAQRSYLAGHGVKLDQYMNELPEFTVKHRYKGGVILEHEGVLYSHEFGKGTLKELKKP